MSPRPPSLGLVADRRIREAAQAAPALDVRGPVSKTVGRASGTLTPDRLPGAGLTRRERRVKEVLLKELGKLNARNSTGGLSYAEKQRLDKTLDVAFIDREVAKMERQLRPRPWLLAFAVLGSALYVGLRVAPHVGEPMTWLVGFDLLTTLLFPIAMVGNVVFWRRATRRRLWIYQALRELSDAEDEGVQLDESVRLADLLIDRLVEAEDAAARPPLHRIRT